MFSPESYRAAHEQGAVVRRTDRGVLAVSGADRASWLQGLVTNDVASMAEGESRYTAYLTPQGRMITDMNVVSSGDRLLLDVPASLAGSLRDRLDALIFSEDVRITDESARLHVWSVIEVSTLQDPRTAGPRDSGTSPAGIVETIGDSLPEHYRALPEIDLDTFETIRIERGIPRFLVDMDHDTIPLEAGIEDRAISFTKGCYVGQEIIVRVTHRGGGRVAKKLVRWRAVDETAAVPPRDARIAATDRDVGRVTSAVFSPAHQRVVGLGYAHRDFTTPGTKVTLVWNDARVEAEVI
jgi:folate-binding protein YgfZ